LPKCFAEVFWLRLCRAMTHLRKMMLEELQRRHYSEVS
jgi:hypothetical protein